MVEERITTYETPAGAPVGAPPATHTTVIHDGARRGGSSWLIALVLVLALVAGIYFFSRASGSEAVKDNAIANAATEVGDAAKEVGSAARDAADSVTNR